MIHPSSTRARWLRAAALCGAALLTRTGSGYGQTAPPEVYALRSADFGGRFVLKSVTPFRFDLSVVGRSAGHHVGELTDVTATPSGAGWVYHPDADCELTITRTAPRVLTVRQVGSCASAGFGAFVDASGAYRRR